MIALDLVSDPLRPRADRRGREVKAPTTTRSGTGSANESPLRPSPARRPKSWRDAGDVDPRIVVDWAMRYGKPSIAERLDRAERAGLRPHPALPLYPQYSATTTATANDKLFRALMTHALAAGGAQRAALLRRAGLYRGAGAFDRRGIWRRLTSSRRWSSPPFTASRRPISSKGDPYHCHCQKTTRLLRERLGWRRAKLIITFQSRFGRAGMAAALHRRDGRETGRATA